MADQSRRLPFARKVKVMAWIQGNKDAIHEKRPTYHQAAEMASTFNGNALRYGALVAKVNRLEKQMEELLAALGH